MNIITIFLATVIMASTVAVGTIDNGGDQPAPTTSASTLNVNDVPPPAPPEEVTVLGGE